MREQGDLSPHPRNHPDHQACTITECFLVSASERNEDERQDRTSVCKPAPMVPAPGVVGGTPGGAVREIIPFSYMPVTYPVTSN